MWIILTELSLRQVVSPTIKQNPNKLALHPSPPEVTSQLSQQKAEEPAKRPEKKPKERSRLGSQNLVSGPYSCQGHSWEKSLLSTVFGNSWETGRWKRKKIKQNKPRPNLLSTTTKSQDRAERRHTPPFVSSQHCDTKALQQMRKYYLHSNTVS